MKHVSRISIFLAVFALCAPSLVTAAANAGKVVYAIGDVIAKDTTGTRRALKKGDAVAAGDTVATGKGRTQLKLTDGSLVALNPNTDYAIEDYEYSASAPDSGRSIFNLLRGGVRFVTGQIGKVNRRNWRLRTAVATIGIRGTGAYTRYGDESLKDLYVDVDEGELESEDPVTGEKSVLVPGIRYKCSSPCKPVDGPGESEDLTYLEIAEPIYEGGEDQSGGGEGPIPAGPAPDGTHISVSFSFTEPNPSFPFGPMTFLNSIADGEETDGMVNIAEFGSLEMFEWFTGFPCEPCVFTRNGAQEVVDPAPNGSTFNTELSAEWGRVVDGWNITDSSGNHTYVSHFHWVASTDPTPPANLPTSGVMVYDQDVGGTLATHEFGVGQGAQTEVATTRTNVRIQVDYGNGGSIDDFTISGSFPSGTTYALQSAVPSMKTINDGFISFASPLPVQHITVPAGSVPDIVSGGMGMCASGCTFFGTAVYGAAGPNAEGITGAFQGNTSQFSYPPHSINGTFIVTP